MIDLICPFSAPLVKKDFLCPFAQEIIRRGGAEIACQKSTSHTRCGELHEKIKPSALAAMGHEDDLLTVPHNVLVKIQYGGLLALQDVLQEQDLDADIKNLDVLVAQAMETYPDEDTFPHDRVNQQISNYKTQRRGKR